MKSRKLLLSERRKKKASDLKVKNRDLWVRKLLRRHGITPAHNSPETECFRGYDAYVSNVFPIGQCMVGVVKGCTFCRGSETGFAQIHLGQTRNLSFKCRAAAPADHPRLWITQSGELSKSPIPGTIRVPRQKPKVDSHGHVIREGGPRPPSVVPIEDNVGYVASNNPFDEPSPGYPQLRSVEEIDTDAIVDALNNLAPANRELVRNALEANRVKIFITGDGNIQFIITDITGQISPTEEL